MLSQEWQFKQYYSDLLAAYQSAFPKIAPPELRWFIHWLEKYPAWAIKDVIRTLEQHPLKANFTTQSTGKAISALLRSESLKRAVAGGTISGGA